MWSKRAVVVLITFVLPAAGLRSEEFIRGDANRDGRRDISDALFTLGYLFLNGPAPLCAAALEIYVQDRAGYDYQHHAEVGSDNARFVSDEVVDRFCLVGPVEAHRQKLRKLADVGVTQFNIYLMCGDEEQTLEIYKRDVLPEIRGVA